MSSRNGGKASSFSDDDNDDLQTVQHCFHAVSLYDLKPMIQLQLAQLIEKTLYMYIVHSYVSSDCASADVDTVDAGGSIRMAVEVIVSSVSSSHQFKTDTDRYASIWL